MQERRRIPLEIAAAHAHVCSPAVRLEMLSRSPLFGALTSDELAEVDSRCRALAFDEGGAIYHAGEAADRVYVVATGAAKVVRLAPDGRQTLLDLSGPGDYLGAVPALGLTEHVDSAWALVPSCLLGLDSDEFTAVMNEFPAVALATLAAVSQRLSVAQQSVHLLSGTPLGQRLAATLLLLAEKIGEPWEGGTLLQAPLSREDLAAMTGAATESVSRILSTWRRDGLIESGRRWVALRDPSALQQIRDREV